MKISEEIDILQILEKEVNILNEAEFPKLSAVTVGQLIYKTSQQHLESKLDLYENEATHV